LRQVPLYRSEPDPQRLRGLALAHAGLLPSLIIFEIFAKNKTTNTKIKSKNASNLEIP
jgi:hypothetical protein